jgi:serine/threonine protein kinase
MPEIGQQISHYRILEKIGVGGMNEVYRAKDQKLGRDRAIRILLEELARDADREPSSIHRRTAFHQHER